MRKKCCDMVKISSNIILYVEFSQSYYFINCLEVKHIRHIMLSRFSEEEIESARSLSDLQLATVRVNKIPENSTHETSIHTEDDPTF